MTDSTHTEDRANGSDKIIDLTIKEVHISHEELAENYVDVKQAGQLLDNSSERTFYRLLNTVKDKFKFSPAKVTVSQNGVSKNLFLKTDILKMGELLNKQAAVIAYRTEYLSASNGASDNQADSQSAHGRASAERPQSVGRAPVSPESSEESGNTKLAVIEGLKSISEFRTDMRELNGNVRDLNVMMQNTISKVIEQGIDLKERYLDDRIKRTEIERLQAESMARQSEALVSLERVQTENMSKQNNALIQQGELIKALLEKKPESTRWNIFPIAISLTAFLLIVFAGVGGSVWISNSQKRLAQQFDEKLSQERQLQKDQYQETIKQLQESLSKLAIVNSVGNPSTVEPVKK